jgi:hypothetical protein
MDAMRESWTDERLDDLRSDVNRRFDEVDRRFDRVDKRFDDVDHELHRVNDRLDGMGRAIIFGSIALSTSYMAGFLAIAFG